ncbi:MAG: ATP-binding protein [Oscillospiraceae bacterium]|nr:ATP-binding protein [Oscillospiraceae bacterium]
MKVHRGTFGILLAALLLAAFLQGCAPGGAPDGGAESGAYASYLDIPGVTEEDVRAVEALWAEKTSFTYGMTLSPEAFLDEDGRVQGFSALFCDWLTELFGVPFIPAVYDRDGLTAGLESGAVDFTGDIAITEESRARYMMTGAIAERYAEAEGDPHTLAFTSVSLATLDSRLAPIVRVMQNALDDGAVRHLVRLYNQGRQDYTRHTFSALLSDTERAYIRSRPVVPVAAEVTNYPVSFYNSREGLWQGIAIDVLGELEKLTGIEFTIINSSEEEWPELLSALETGRAAVITELLHTDERAGRFLWPDNKLFADQFVLISKIEHHDISINEILYTKVGTVKGTAHAALFRQWFPDHASMIEYEHNNAALEALEQGEIEMMMSSRHRLLNITNYREQAGYKANFTFDITFESTFGFNTEYAVLCSVVDKALGLIDTDGIYGYWMRRTFDYRVTLEQQRTSVLLGATVILFVFVFMIVLFVRTRGERSRLENLVQSRTEALEDAIASAETANRSKTAFLASMSHEIRTPMNAIIGMLELLTHEPLNARQRGYIEDINHSAASLLTIINDILDMSKIEAGKMELVPVDYDFLALLDNMHSMFTYVAEEKGLEFRFEVSGDTPHYLYGDDIRLRQVIINICGNAVKFTEKGHVLLKVSHAAGMLSFEISDTGRGIKKEDVAKLFNAFQQTDTTKNREVAGTGLGLTISKSFIEMMGGSITVESEYEKGTVFTVTVPLVPGDGEKVKAAVVPKGKKLFAPKADILVVDDNEFNLKVAVGLLNLSSITADTASSGYIALEMIKQKDYHVIFMDHMMPEMDGVETTAAIRAQGGKFEKLTVIALTANAVQGAKELFLASGFDDFISKPIDVRELASLLEKWLPEDVLEKAPEIPDEPDGGQTGFWEVLKGVDGINTTVGLNAAAGVESLYYQAVELCCSQLPAECGKMSESLSGGDIGGFAISVHAMKSVLATIGAVDLSETALRLEMAAKSGDAAFCEEVFPPFHDALLAFRAQISAAFPQAPSDAEKAPGDAQALRAGVELALAAAEAYDNDAGLDAVRPLLAFDFGEETNALLTAAVKEFNEFDCEKAGEILRKVPL